MARPSEHTFGYEVLNSPPSIYGTEVSAEWKRTRKGEVIMTGRMPHDAVDSEVYIITFRGHSGISMDPWASLTWRKTWNNYHTSNEITKDILNKLNQERTHRHIRLHKTAGRQKHFRSSYWYPRLNRKQDPLPYGLSAGHPSTKTAQAE